VRPDGVLVRGGGKVVKNVAGFDLPKLAVGSLGTLFGIVEATVRVYPIPAARTRLAFAMPSQAAADRAVLAFVARRLEPEALVSHHEQTIVVDFAGTASGVAEQSAVAELVLREFGGTPTEMPTVRSGVWRMRVTVPPAGTAPEGGRWEPNRSPYTLVYPLLGVLWGISDGPFSIDVLHRMGTTAVLHALPLASRPHYDVWGPPPPSFPLMRALKATFDPHGLCNPGRFVGGL